MKNAFLLTCSLFFVLHISQAQEWGLGPFYKTRKNPIATPDSTYSFYCPIEKETIQWQKADVFNPAAIVKDHKVYLFTRCEDNPRARLGRRTSRIGISVSKDGINFKKFPEPVLFPAEDAFKQYDYKGGCEDPRIIEVEGGLYVMAYTSWNYKTPRLSVAFSHDLFHWEKKGPAFAKAYDGRFLDMASKSGSIVTRMDGDRPVAAKIKGRYWMYWGERFVNLAWSENLSDWYPLLDEKGNLKRIITPREGKFDSDLTECGPPALVTDKGILLIYNGKNANNAKADPSISKGTYSVGQVLLNKEDLETVLERTETCILKPSLPHEVSGQYAAGTTFAEGLVFFKGKWYLYYGTADSFVGLAISKQRKRK